MSLDESVSADQDLRNVAQTGLLRADLLDVSVSWVEGIPTMALTGEVDMASVPIVHERLGEIAGKVRGDLVIDLGLVTFLDSAGLSFLVTAHQQLASQGGRLVVFAPTPQVRRLFDVSALSSYLVIMPEEQDEG
jgi:stage II sporulation protein AA (anti-sigma F factor antagonist)